MYTYILTLDSIKERGGGGILRREEKDRERKGKEKTETKERLVR